jgi:membrane-associated protease RseP (regulator of RpoE activity)
MHSGVLFRLVGLPGHNSQGYLGVDLRSVTEEQATALKLKDVHGVEITGVDHDAPACKAGLLIHDVILQMNGHIVEGEEQLRHMLKEMPAGRQVTLVISRDGQQRTIQTQLANREEVEREAWEKRYIVPEPADSSPAYIPHTGNSFLAPSKSTSTKGTHSFLGTSMQVSASYTGARLEVVGPQLAEFFGAQGHAGLLVQSVEPNSPAADAGLKAGDVVVKVNSVEIASANDWSKTIHENRGRTVNVIVLREKKEQSLTLVPDAKKRSSVEPWANLHGFFDNSSQNEQIEAAVAEVDDMAMKMRRQLDQIRSMPEVRQMSAKLNALASDPELERQLNISRQQLTTAMETARLRVDSPELRSRMNSLRDQMRQAMGLN